jgi:hypothetical protein
MDYMNKEHTLNIAEKQVEEGEKLKSSIDSEIKPQPSIELGFPPDSI